MGGRLAAVSHSAGPRHRAPGGTQLLPRQVISGRDATAQDVATDCVKSETLSNEAFISSWSHIGLHHRPKSTWTQFTGASFVKVSWKCCPFGFICLIPPPPKCIIGQCVIAVYLLMRMYFYGWFYSLRAPQLLTKDGVTSAEWLQSISSDGNKIKGKINLYWWKTNLFILQLVLLAGAHQETRDNLETVGSAGTHLDSWL